MSDFNDLFKDVTENMDDMDACHCVVRLKTGFWSNNKGIHVKKDITYLRRLSGGSNYVEEDVSNVGAEDVINSIINFWECVDGVYEIITCNVSTDWETGYMDGYDYKLIPFSPPKEDSLKK